MSRGYLGRSMMSRTNIREPEVAFHRSKSRREIPKWPRDCIRSLKLNARWTALLRLPDVLPNRPAIDRALDESHYVFSERRDSVGLEQNNASCRRQFSRRGWQLFLLPLKLRSSKCPGVPQDTRRVLLYLFIGPVEERWLDSWQYEQTLSRVHSESDAADVPKFLTTNVRFDSSST